MRITITAVFWAASAFGQTAPPRMSPVEAHEINGLFLSHLEAQARHVQPRNLNVRVPASLPPSRPAIAMGPLTDPELLAIRPVLTAARAAIQAV